MTIEQLKAMTNKELDRLAAIKFLWNGFVNEPSGNWKPTEDMNQAMELLKGSNYAIINNKVQVHLRNGIRTDAFIVEEESLPRAITIAAILAKVEQGNE